MIHTGRNAHKSAKSSKEKLNKQEKTPKYTVTLDPVTERVQAPKLIKKFVVDS